MAPPRSLTLVLPYLVIAAFFPPIAESSDEDSFKISAPIYFEENLGQGPAGADFLLKGSGTLAYLYPDRLEHLVGNRVGGPNVKIKFNGAQENSKFTGVEKLPGKASYLFGNGGKGDIADLSMFSKVRRKELYKGIDLEVYTLGPNLIEYDFVVAAGADPSPISIEFTGAEVKVLKDGSLSLTQDGNNTVLLQKSPVLYQKYGEKTKTIPGRYILSAQNTVKFEIGAYDTDRPLIIDPKVEFLSYTAGYGFKSIRVDSKGFIYVLSQHMLKYETVVSKFDPHFSKEPLKVVRISNGLSPYDMEIDHEDRIYVVGTTSRHFLTGTTFPTTENAHLKPEDILDSGVTVYEQCVKSWCTFGYLTVFSEGLDKVLYSTLIGAANNYLNIVGRVLVSDEGIIYTVGYAQFMLDWYGYPIGDFLKKNALFNIYNVDAPYNTITTTFVNQYDISKEGADSLLRSSPLSSINGSLGSTVDLDPDGNFNIVYPTVKQGYPILDGFGRPSPPLPEGDELDLSYYDLYLAVYDLDNFEDPTQNLLLYSTYLGGLGRDYPMALEVSDAGAIYILGQTESSEFLQGTGDYPYLGDLSMFVTRIDPRESIRNRFLGPGQTVLGPNTYLHSPGDGRLIIAGWTNRDGLSKGLAFQPYRAMDGGGFIGDGFIGVLNDQTLEPDFISYLGGSANDAVASVTTDQAGRILACGTTSSPDLNTTKGVFSESTTANKDNKIVFGDPTAPEGFVIRLGEDQVFLR